MGRSAAGCTAPPERRISAEITAKAPTSTSSPARRSALVRARSRNPGSRCSSARSTPPCAAASAASASKRPASSTSPSRSSRRVRPTTATHAVCPFAASATTHGPSLPPPPPAPSPPPPPRAASDAANTCAEGTGITEIPRASASAFAKAIETRRPVKPPGPTATATEPSSLGSTPRPAPEVSARSSSQKASRGACMSGVNLRLATVVRPAPSGTASPRTHSRCEQSTRSIGRASAALTRVAPRRRKGCRGRSTTARGSRVRRATRRLAHPPRGRSRARGPGCGRC